MALFTAMAGGDYSRERMPRPAFGDGPWGEAIRYWLEKRKLRQADIAKTTGVRPNTISRATRGFHTTTRVLEKIAKAVEAPFDAILVSPERKLANEERRQLAREVSEDVLRAIDARGGLPTTENATREHTLTLATQIEHVGPETRRMIDSLIADDLRSRKPQQKESRRKKP